MEDSFAQGKHNQKFRKILQVAARLFAKKGYEKVSIEEIAWKLNLTKGSLYHYFKSKEEVLFLIQRDSLSIGIAALAGVRDSDQDPLSKLKDAIRTHVEIVTRQEVAGALLQQELILPRLYRDPIIEARDRYEGIFRDIVSQGIQQGVFSARNWRLSCIAALSLLNGISKWYSPRGEKTLEEITEAVTDFIVKGFQPGQPPPVPGLAPLNKPQTAGPGPV